MIQTETRFTSVANCDEFYCIHIQMKKNLLPLFQFRGCTSILPLSCNTRHTFGLTTLFIFIQFVFYLRDSDQVIILAFIYCSCKHCR
ncbi:Os05g0431333 [Oryza sativa Japonica Group]|uniref:Os05g0431333 protein n=1 Tax=Oryza sativa subsp. japonica TaxID=39947 RepID=A0A0P0WMN2_ORYSJ|nr:hypothetical protein EE612_029681 [Oryza sativa]BAS94164.1 Os05g0431333 [Oryza sativa Japonica Group]